MQVLIAKWRQKAAEPLPTGPAGRVARHRRYVLNRCADELEQAWHDDKHDGSWYPEICPICVKEMAENQ